MTDTNEDRLDLKHIKAELNDDSYIDVDIIERLVKEVEQLREVVDGYTKLIKVHHKHEIEYDEEIDSLTKDLEQYKNLANGYAERLKDAEMERDALNLTGAQIVQENIKLDVKITELKAGYKKAIEEVRELSEAKGKIQAENAELKKVLNELRQRQPSKKLFSWWIK